MSLFDSVINEARAKFNLGDKANVLLSVLLAKITDKSRGGLGGFLERFNTAGLSGIASSWMNSGANTSISGEQLESALGSEIIQDIADKTGIDYETTTSAIAFMLPRVVDTLTPEGILPEENDLLSRAGTYLTADENSLTSARNTFDRIGTSAADVIDADRASAGDRIGIADSAQTIGGSTNTAVENITDFEDANDDSPLKWLIPLVILVLLIILGYSFCSKAEEHKTANISTINQQI
jgi:uncharacterized protein YidB (DUF937 family)